MHRSNYFITAVAVLLAVAGQRRCLFLALPVTHLASSALCTNLFYAWSCTNNFGISFVFLERPESKWRTERFPFNHTTWQPTLIATKTLYQPELALASTYQCLLLLLKTGNRPLHVAEEKRENSPACDYIEGRRSECHERLPPPSPGECAAFGTLSAVEWRGNDYDRFFILRSFGDSERIFYNACGRRLPAQDFTPKIQSES